MSTGLLFEHFATLATAPDGIVRLRELILQLAVQGKLGTQDAGDEPASVLLVRIRNEKERSVKEGKIKREKPLDSIGETPFILPKTWVWEKLGNCVPKITDGEHFRPNTVKNGVMFLSAKDIRENHIDFLDPLFVDEGTAERCRQRCNPEINDILVVSRGAGIGRCCIISTNELFCLLGSVILIKSNHLIDSKYLLFSLKSTIINKQITSLSSNTAQQALYIRDIKDALIPLPPLAEQHRIVAKVNRLMAICDELEAQQHQERAGCLKLGTASLAGLQNATHPEEFGRQWAQVCEAFDLILDCPENVAVLRQTILQLTVQGRLVRQEPGDEPARKLSMKILEEKKRLIKQGEISKSRDLTEIESEEIPFQIPKNWIWLRIDDIGHSCGQKVPDKVFTYIDVTAIKKEKGLIGDEVNVLQPNEAPSRARKLVRKGTVIYSTVRPYLLNIAIVDKEFNPEPIVSTAFAVLHPFEGIFNRYLFYYLRSKPFIEYVESQMTGMAYPAINDFKFHMGLIPIPPTAEQHRIVSKVDALMALCDALESRLKERAGVQARFADSIVKGIGVKNA